MVGESQVVVAAEREDLLPVHDDARPLRALADQAAAAQAAPLEFGKLVGEALEDQGRPVRRKAAWLMLAV
jgi:hypothetical protein